MAIEHAARMTKYVIEMLDAWKCVQVCKPGRLMCWLSFWHLTAACSWRDYDVIMTGFGLRWRVYDAIATRFGFWWRDCSLLISDFMPRCAFCCQGFSREHRWFSWQLNTCHMNDEVCNQDAECAQMRTNAWVCFDWVVNLNASPICWEPIALAKKTWLMVNAYCPHVTRQNEKSNTINI